MKYAVFAVLSFLCICNVGCESKAVQILPLGDSITAGLTVIQGVHTFDGGYRRKLELLLDAQKVDFDFVGSQTDPDTALTHRKHHEGHSGWKIEDLDAQLDVWIPAAHPDVVLLLAGTNDVLTQNHLDMAPSRLMAMIDHIQNLAPEAWIFTSSILPIHDSPMSDQVGVYNSSIEAAILARQSRGEKIRFVDMNGNSGLTSAYTDLPDGIHPAMPGYEKMADVWFSALKDSFTPDFAILSSPAQL